MIKFVNAKLNLGLSVVRRRADGYHDLETLFYPVGRFNGTPENPTPFCDILEITENEKGDCDDFRFWGRQIDCPPEKNLVVRAARAFRDECAARGIELPYIRLTLEKHLPDGAGLGGGSADAAFTLTMLNEMTGTLIEKEALSRMALALGADCPFFVENRPLFAGGVGERFEEVDLDLSGWWALIVKPDVYVSTKEAFAGITPHEASFDLRKIDELAVEEWKGKVVNDFEASIFPLHPELAEIKEKLYERGAVYASMSGSGSSIYGLYKSRDAAIKAASTFGKSSYICKL